MSALYKKTVVFASPHYPILCQYDTKNTETPPPPFLLQHISTTHRVNKRSRFDQPIMFMHRLIRATSQCAFMWMFSPRTLFAQLYR